MLGMAHHQPGVAIQRWGSVISLNNRRVVTGARTHQARAVHLQASPPRVLLVVCHITPAAALAPRKFVAFPHRRPLSRQSS